MSNLTGLPPSALIRAASNALNQEVAIRLINLPDGLSNNPQPVKLTGTVIGQTPEGHVQLQTDRGVINIMLKDRGTLPVGQSFEIEIPAGRTPQQGSLRQAPAQPSSSQSPASSPGQILTGGLAASLGSAMRLDRATPLKPDELAEALANLKPGQDIPTAPLQAGQTLRLIPLPLFNQSLQTQIPIPTDTVFTQQEMFTALLNMIEQATDIPLQTRQALTQVLSNVDIAALFPPSSQQAQNNSQEQLQTAFQKQAQSLDLPDTIQLRNSALPNTPAPIVNPSRPLDVQILAFQSGNFGTALSQVSTGQSLPAMTPQNMIVIQPQPSSPPPQNQTPIPIANTATTATPSIPPQINIPANPSTSLPPPPAMLGQITGFTPQGQPIISLPVSGSLQPLNYVVQFATSNVIVGAPVVIAPLPASSMTPAIPVTTPGIVPFGIGQNVSLPGWAQPEIWDSFQNLITNVAHINPAMAQAMTQMIPAAAQPQNMGALSLFFLSMMRTGDVDTWIGPSTVDLLKQSGKIDILRGVAGDNNVFNRLETTPLPNDWRATMLPFWANQQVHKLPLYYKQWNDEDATDRDDQRRKKLRFLFALNLSRMGEVQVDGFMQKEKLDMILRTKSMVSTNMQQALKKIYHKSMERSNLSGEITFQFKPEQWVSIEMPA